MRPILVSVLIVLGAAVGASGCGASCEDFCEGAADCEGDEELAECKKECADTEERAEKRECIDQFDEYVSCIAEESTCEDEDYDYGDRCDSEAEAFDECFEPEEDI